MWIVDGNYCQIVNEILLENNQKLKRIKNTKIQKIFLHKTQFDSFFNYIKKNTNIEDEIEIARSSNVRSLKLSLLKFYIIDWKKCFFCCYLLNHIFDILSMNSIKEQVFIIALYYQIHEKIINQFDILTFFYIRLMQFFLYFCFTFFVYK